MDRRKFITLSLSSAALTALSGCRLRPCGGGINCSRKPLPPYYSYSQTTSLRIFYHGETLLFLTPEFHLVHEYLRIDNLNPERSVALSKKLFAGLPEKLLAKAYLKHGHDAVDKDLLFTGESQNTRVFMGLMQIVWAKSELSAEEIALLDKTIAQYNKQLEALDVSVYTRYSPPLRIIPMHSIFWISSYPSVDPKFRPPALRNKDDSVYEFSYAPEEAEIYAADTYPADFFDSARSVDYQPETFAKPQSHASGLHALWGFAKVSVGENLEDFLGFCKGFRV